MNINSELFWISLRVNIILILQKYLFWGYSKWQQIKQSAPGLKRGMTANFSLLKSTNHVEFIEKCMKGREKHV